MDRYVVSITTNASGAATSYTGSAVSGRIDSIRYVPHATTPLDTGADLVISGEDSGAPILTITNIGTSAVTFAPRQAVCGVTGTASLYAADGTAVQDRIGVANERIKIVTANGGDALSGKIHITVDP